MSRPNILNFETRHPSISKILNTKFSNKVESADVAELWPEWVWRPILLGFKHGCIGMKGLPGKPIDKYMRYRLSPIVKYPGDVAAGVNLDAKRRAAHVVDDDVVALGHAAQWIGSGLMAHDNAEHTLFGRKICSHIAYRKPDRSYPVITFIRVQGITAIESSPCRQDSGLRMAGYPGTPACSMGC